MILLKFINKVIFIKVNLFINELPKEINTIFTSLISEKNAKECYSLLIELEIAIFIIYSNISDSYYYKIVNIFISNFLK